jgi:aryl-alcohol dehydrogenase-like predicted oxidoreductase
MKQVAFGKTGETVSQVCLGAMIMGTTTDRETSYEMLDGFLGEGGNFIDTANCYAWWIGQGQGGESERLLGEWMKERRNREKIFLATKGGAAIRNLNGLKDAQGNILWDRVRGEYEYLSAPVLRRALEGSLRRLQVETIDLYYVHVDDRVTPIEETLEALDCFVKEGKVRFIGCSNFRTWRLERSLGISRARGWAQYAAVQEEYSYLRPKPDTDFGIGVHTDDEQLDFLKANEDVALVAYSPLLKGIYDDAHKRERYYNWPFYNTDDSRVRLRVLSEMAAQLGVSNNQLVLAWLLHHQPRVIPIIAASGVEQFWHNLGALKIELNAEQMATLNGASA